MSSAVLLSQPVVIDNGTAILKAGFAGGDRPSVIFDSICGRVKHERVMPGGALEGVDLELVDVEGRVVKTMRTDFDGFFVFEGVPYGEYSVRIAELSAQAIGVNAALGRRAFVSDETDSVRLGTVAVGGPIASSE